MELLRKKREECGYTQQRLADAVGVTQTAISLIESGDRLPSVPLAKKIGNVLGFEWSELYNDNNKGE